MKAAASYAQFAVLALASALYFTVGIDMSLDWVDEGQVLYFSKRVSEGALPYRDFQNIYGPSFFFVNGALIRIFGLDVIVIRILIVALKTIMAIYVYASGTMLGPRPLAVAAWLLTVIMLGTPWPWFTTPYANYYGLSISMMAILYYAAASSSLDRRCLIAGLGFGLAATFKLTNGLFPFIAVLLHLIWLCSAGAPQTSRNEALSIRLLGGLRVAAVLGFGGVIAAYLSHGGTLVQAASLSSPIVLLMGWGLYREIHARPSAELSVGTVRAAAWLAFGAALPLAMVVGAFAYAGLLDELVYNMLSGLPQKFDWFVPLPRPGVSALLFVVALAAGLMGLRMATGSDTSIGSRAWRSGSAFLLALASSGFLSWRIQNGDAAWHSSGADLFAVIPFAAVWGAIVLLLRRPSRPEIDAERWADRDLLLLFTLNAAVSILYLHPSADPAHVMMAAPAILPLLVPCLAAVSRWRNGWWGVVAAGLIAIPFMYTLAITLENDRTKRIELTRASGIAVPGELYRDGARLVRYLESPAVADRQVFVVSGKPLIYFLSDRRSPLDAHEFSFYMTALGVLDEADAREMVDEAAVMRALAEAEPLFVTDDFDSSASRFARTHPALWAEIEASTHVTRKIGGFSVRDWKRRTRDTGSERGRRLGSSADG